MPTIHGKLLVCSALLRTRALAMVLIDNLILLSSVQNKLKIGYWRLKLHPAYAGIWLACCVAIVSVFQGNDRILTQCKKSALCRGDVASMSFR